MYRSRVSLLALLALAVLVTTLAGCGRKGLVRVNGDKVKKEEFYARLERVPVNTPQGLKPAGRYVMEQIIAEKLIRQLAKKEGVDPTVEQMDKKVRMIKKIAGPDFAQTLRQQGKTESEWRDQLTLEQALSNVVCKGIKVPDSEVKKTYDQMLAAKNSPLIRPESVRISAIFTKSKEKIDKAYALLQQGQEFGAIAMKMSEAPGAAQSQGVIGSITRDLNVVPENIRAAAFALSNGEYTKPMQSEQSWIIIRTDQKRPRKVTAYNDIKEMIREQLAVKEGSEKNNFQKTFQEFTKSADIVINAERYKDVPKAIQKQAAEALKIQADKLGAGATGTIEPTETGGRPQ